MTTTKERHNKSHNGAARKSARAEGKGLSNFTVLAGAVGAGAALGVAALIGRKAVVQAPTALAGDWAEALAIEHRAVLKVFDTIEATEDKAVTKRTLLLAHLKQALTKHAVEEENVIYPALREAGETEAFDELSSEHALVKNYLFRLDNMPKDSAAFLTVVREFRREIEDHMREEEEVLFPKLKAQRDDEGNKALFVAMNKEGFKVA
ncbi:hemerythrin domain-containing protein [Sphingomonas sp. FW199]|uniref:hemerythrin domain-containing protein n=1 Tax=Sphingomonas sp. FW199 TaxID=3400217 RepID=UPI003CF977FD